MKPCKNCVGFYCLSACYCCCLSLSNEGANVAESFAVSSASNDLNTGKSDKISDRKAGSVGSGFGRKKTMAKLIFKMRRILSSLGIVSFRPMSRAADSLKRSCEGIECTLQRYHESRQDV